MAFRRPKTVKSFVMIIITTLFVSVFANVTLPSSFAVDSVDGTIPCNCVIFRLDDVADDNRAAPAMAVMDTFLSRNQDLSLGIIMNHFGNNSRLLGRVVEGYNRGLFELDIHGWNHVDYTTLSPDMQASTLALAKGKMYKLFGDTPNVFIPPGNNFNNDTIKAMEHSNLTIISSDESHERNSSRYFVSDGSTRIMDAGIARLPGTDYMGVIGTGGKVWKNLSETYIISSAKRSIAKYGNAVIILHPQSYLLAKDGKMANILNNTAISELYGLIGSFKAQNIHITTFSKTVQYRPRMSILHARQGEADYIVTAKSSYVNATSISIVPKTSVKISVEGNGKMELSLPKSMIDGIYSISATDLNGSRKDIQFQQEDSLNTKTISVDVPSGTQALTISAATVVPEFDVPMLAIAAASVLYLIAAKSRKIQLRRNCP
jgi:peptidoglycan/xylan/chitin deacetylase (PgdA/CDA1 family)